MEFTGKITQILSAQQGQSSKGPWQKQEFIIETQEQFPKKICIAVWNNKFTVKELEGSIVNISADVESREFNGKWYTDIKAWKIEKLHGDPSQNSNVNNMKEDFNKTDPFIDKSNESILEDDLPF